MHPLKKPSIFFGDALASDDELSAAEDEQWICKADGEWFFLPPIERSHSLGYLHCLSVPRHMDWELIRPIRGLPVCRSVDLNVPPWSEEMFGVFPGCVRCGYPTGKTPQIVRTFGRHFS